MEEITLPEIMNTEEKYNILIHEMNTLRKFEAIYMKLLSDENLDMAEIFKLMKIIERDVILVHKLTEASALMEMTETFIKYIIIKDDEVSKKEDQKTSQKGEEEEQQQPPTNMKKKKKFVKDTSKKQKKEKATTVTQELEKGILQCDC